MNVSSMDDMTQCHAGTIEIDSAPGHGSLTQLEPQRSLYILFIDDDAGVRDSLNACFKHYNHRVVLASGGKHGLELFRTATLKHQPYEVVITDLGMPDIDGHRVARTIKAESPNTPVIMMTGWGTFMSDEEGIALEVDAVVSKPARMRELNDLVLRIAPPARPRL